MRLVSYYNNNNELAAGVVRGEDVFDVNAVLAGLDLARRFDSVRELLESTSDELDLLTSWTADPDANSTISPVGKFASIRLGPPVANPDKVICVGLNYSDHVAETGRKLPEFPDLFTKFSSSLIGPRDTISCSEVSANLDFEGEMAIVIGRTTRLVDEATALASIAGLMVLNDTTARDLQYRGTQWLAGKALDGSTPCGPALVTLDEVGDPQALDIRTRVNGIQVQSSNTSSMIFSVARIVSYVSSFLTLNPGDVIATGTPEGIGAKRQPPLWLKIDDVVEVEIERLGTIRNVIR